MKGPLRVMLLTEGDAEFKSLPYVMPQFNGVSPHTVMNPLKVNLQPDAGPGVIARQCKSRVEIAVAKGADLVVLVIDREKQDACPGLIASRVEAAISRVCNSVSVRVVLKDRTYENWLVADLNALAAQPKRFDVTPARRKRVEPDKADIVNALALMKDMVVGPAYEKVSDAEKICASMDVGRAARHSRSLRHLLHVLDVPAYAAGCKRSAAP